VEYSVGHALGHPEVPVTDARVLDDARALDDATVQVADAEPDPEPVVADVDPPVLVARSGLTALPPFALEKSQLKEP
jgi:hypothetical protein